MGTQDGLAFSAMEPATQVEVLATLAQHARVLEFAVEGEGAGVRTAATELQRAIENAMDADDAEVGSARRGLAFALSGVCRAGLQLSARLNEISVDGILGRTKLAVLTTVLEPVGHA